MKKTVKQIWKESAGQGQEKRRELVKKFFQENHGKDWQEQYSQWSNQMFRRRNG